MRVTLLSPARRELVIVALLSLGLALVLLFEFQKVYPGAVPELPA